MVVLAVISFLVDLVRMFSLLEKATILSTVILPLETLMVMAMTSYGLAQGMTPLLVVVVAIQFGLVAVTM